MPFTAASLAELLIRSRAEYIELQKLITNNVNANPEIWREKCHGNLDFIKKFIEESGWPSSSLLELERDEVTTLRTILLEKYGWQDCDSFSDKKIAELVEYSAWMSVQHGDANNMELAQIIGQKSGTITMAELEETRPDLLEQQQEIIAKQEFCLAKMQEQNASPHHIAFVTDRIKRNKGETQIYNTQFQANPLYPHKITEIENPETIERRRKEMNLDSNEEHMQHRHNVFNGKQDPSMLMPPIVRNNAAITSFKQFKAKAKILVYGFALNEQDPNLYIPGFETEIFIARDANHLAKKLLETANDPNYLAIANFSGGSGQAIDTINVMANLIENNQYSLPERSDMKFLVFSDSDKIGRFFSYQGLGQTYLIGPPLLFNQAISPENFTELLNILNQDKQENINIELHAVNQQARDYNGNILGITAGGDTESTMQNRGGLYRNFVAEENFANILFLENPNGIDEVERVLKHLKENNELANYKAIIFSKFTGESSNVTSQNLENMVNKYEINVPVLVGYPYGHRNQQNLKEFSSTSKLEQKYTPLPLHANCQIQFRENSCFININPQSSQASELAARFSNRARSVEFKDVDLANLPAEYQAKISGNRIDVFLDNPFLRSNLQIGTNISATNQYLSTDRKYDVNIMIPDLRKHPHAEEINIYEAYDNMLTQAIGQIILNGGKEKISSFNIQIADEEIPDFMYKKLADYQELYGIDCKLELVKEINHPLHSKWENQTAKLPSNQNNEARKEGYDKLLTGIDSTSLSQAKVADHSIKEEGKEQNHDTKWQEKITTTEKSIIPKFN